GERLDIHNSETPVLCRSCEARHRGMCGALKPDELIEFARHTRKERHEHGDELIGDSTAIHAYANVMRGVGVRDRLSWSLSEIFSTHFAPYIHHDGEGEGDVYSHTQTHTQTDGQTHTPSHTHTHPPTYILKPSVTNKGLCIHIIQDWEDMLETLVYYRDTQREWVLQSYIVNPLLICRHKFHIRCYVLCVGALNVYVYGQMLVLMAACEYDMDHTHNVYAHLTNTARGATHFQFNEEKYVHPLSDLASLLQQSHPDRLPYAEQAKGLVQDISEQIHTITGELFACYENEYSVFAPMSHCFEVYGLDFMVDDTGTHK
ncbi:hypothetical protein EON63_25175, partial [archaeon]